MAYSKNDLPFVLDLKILQGQDSVLCEHLLRDLHGKRKVFKGLWGGRTVVVKLFLDPRTARRHWGREKAGVTALKDASVPTPELLFAGDLNDSTPALIFDFLPEAQTSLQVWDGLTTMTQRGDFLLQLVEVVAGLHNAGLVQEDLHLENFLVSDRKIYAIDGEWPGIGGPSVELLWLRENESKTFDQGLNKYLTACPRRESACVTCDISDSNR